MTTVLPFRRATFLAAAMILSAGTQPAFADNVANFLGPNACGGCHTNIAVSWSRSRHARSLTELRRHPAARRMARDLSLSEPTVAEACRACHVTATGSNAAPQSTAGVSCESCHGAAAPWLEIHAGGRSSDTPTNEMEPSSAVARAEAIASGMIPAMPVLTWARGCFDCHVVRREQLVGSAGHPAGSDFELVAWSEGEVRHHLPEKEVDEDEARYKRRLKYVLGAGLDLEYGLRGVAAAKVKGPYGVKMAVRVRIAVARLRRIARADVLEEVNSMLAVAAATRLELGLNEEIAKSADQVAVLIDRIARTHNGERLAAIDVLLPAPSEYVFSRR